MDDQELRLACVEAAADAPIVHEKGRAAGVLEVANLWYVWIKGDKSPKKDQFGFEDLK